MESSSTIVVKVGTSVVSRPDGSLALGRIGSVVEQIAQLVKEGRQAVLVASGAIGIGELSLTVHGVGFAPTPPGRGEWRVGEVARLCPASSNS